MGKAEEAAAYGIARLADAFTLMCAEQKRTNDLTQQTNDLLIAIQRGQSDILEEVRNSHLRHNASERDIRAVKSTLEEHGERLAALESARD